MHYFPSMKIIILYAFSSASIRQKTRELIQKQSATANLDKVLKDFCSENAKGNI